jgi:CRP-like cAMP-binding protein
VAASTTRSPSGPPGGGPSIIVPDLWIPGESPGHPLADGERALLAPIATVSRYKRGETIYQEGEQAATVFNIITGIVKSLKVLPNDKQHIVGFLFPNALVGLAEYGRYVNSAEAVTAVTLYRLPTRALEPLLRQNAKLDFEVIGKLCHVLREAQHHAFLLAKHRAIARVGLFVEFLETLQAGQRESPEEIYLPMSRSDIGEYLGISPEAVSRSFRELARHGAVAFRDRRHLKTIDRALLEAAIAENQEPSRIAKVAVSSRGG